MFHAGAVVPSSLFLLQLLATGDFAPPSVALEEFDPPVNAGLSARSREEEGIAVEFDMPELALLIPRLLLLKAPYGEAPLGVPVCAGLMAPPLFGPIAERNFCGNS